jgi:hypothetical protein
MRLDLNWRTEDGQRLPTALWHPGPGYRMISTGVLGGGFGPREWVLNAQVPAAYARTDPAEHLRELAHDLQLTGPGLGLLTAAQVTDLVQRQDEGVQAAATVGLRVPTWAAARPGRPDPELAPLEPDCGRAGHHQRHRRPAGATHRRGLRQRGRDRHRGQGPGRAGRRVRWYRDRYRRHLHRRARGPGEGRRIHRPALCLGGPDRPGRTRRRPRRRGRLRRHGQQREDVVKFGVSYNTASYGVDPDGLIGLARHAARGVDRLVVAPASADLTEQRDQLWPSPNGSRSAPPSAGATADRRETAAAPCS